MRVTKEHILNGITSFAENDVIPQIEDRATKILIAVAVRSIRANGKLADAVFENSTVKTLLNSDNDGTYEIDDIFRAIEESVKEYGPFPLLIPPIPFVSPEEKELRFTDADIEAIKKRIERSV